MMMRRSLMLLIVLLACGAAALQAGELKIPDGAQWTPQFDVERATNAWIATLPADARARSDAYFEGGYWLPLWSTLWGVGVSLLLLSGRRAARLRDWTERVVRRRALQLLLFAACFIILSWLLGLPYSIYQDWYRERQYGLSTQTFLPWLLDALKSLGVSIVLGSLFLAALYAVVRRTGARWWPWATALTTAFMLFSIVIGPVFIAPLFNDYKPMPASATQASIMSLARANGIPAGNVYVFDASKQTTRISANVSGALGTMRISLNDNLLNQTSLPEIRAVMAHEMGHYVLNHAWRAVIYYFVFFLGLFLLLHRLIDATLARWGARWGLRDRADIAGAPMALALFAICALLASPVLNTITRQAEAEADLFGVNAAREAQGFASVAMRLSTYRKISPTPLEEALFYDHPSGRTRIHMAMQWLKENPPPAAAP